MTKDIIQQIIKSKESALIELPKNIRTDILDSLEIQLPQCYQLNIKTKLQCIDMKRSNIGRWYQRLTHKETDIGREKINKTLERYSFFIYPKLTKSQQYKTWLLCLEIFIEFYQYLGTQLILELNKELVKDKVIRFTPKKGDYPHIFIEPNKYGILPYSFESIPFWIRQNHYENIEYSIMQHLKILLKEDVDNRFANIEKNIIKTNVTIPQKIEAYNYQLVKAIKPEIYQFPYDYVESFESLVYLEQQQILPFITLSTVRFYYKNQDKNSFTERVPRKSAEYVFNQIMQSVDYPKEVFEKIIVTHLHKMISERIAFLEDLMKVKKQSVKDLSFKQLFFNDEERVNDFFKILKRLDVEAIDEQNNWKRKPKSSIVACFKALEKLGKIKNLDNNAELRRIVSEKINIRSTEKLFRNPYKNNDFDFFYKKFEQLLC